MGARQTHHACSTSRPALLTRAPAPALAHVPWPRPSLPLPAAPPPLRTAAPAAGPRGVGRAGRLCARAHAATADIKALQAALLLHRAPAAVRVAQKSVCRCAVCRAYCQGGGAPSPCAASPAPPSRRSRHRPSPPPPHCRTQALLVEAEQLVPEGDLQDLKVGLAGWRARLL